MADLLVPRKGYVLLTRSMSTGYVDSPDALRLYRIGQVIPRAANGTRHDYRVTRIDAMGVWGDPIGSPQPYRYRVLRR